MKTKKLFPLTATGTKSNKSQMHRLGLKPGCPRRRVDQPDCAGQIKIDQRPAVRADRVVVPLCLAIVATGAAAKSHFMNQPCLFQVTQRIVDCGETNSGHRLAGRLKDLSRGRVAIAGADDIEHDLSLARQDGPSTLIIFGRFFPAADSHTWNYNYSNYKVKERRGRTESQI
ncbi:MAG: hypothetical protein QOG23_1121 [Blastocatellia bacterium]|nr:hypothetical protein [Blastocatellia bacterium]